MQQAADIVSSPADDADDEIDLRELLGTLWDRRWLIGIVTGIFLIGSVAYAILAAPVYQATAMVQVEQKIPQLPGLSDLTQMLGASAPEADTEIALMTSRMVVGRAVEKLNLTVQVTPHQFPLVGDFIARHYQPTTPGQVASPWFGLTSYDWGGSKLKVYQLDVPNRLLGKDLTLVAGTGHTFKLYDDDDNLLLQGPIGGPVKGHGVTIQVQTLNANPGTEFDVVRQPRLKTIAHVQSILNASEQGKDTGIIQTQYENTDPARATNILNAVIEQYVLQNVQMASAEAAQSLKFIKGQLPGIHEKLATAESALATYQTKAHTANLDLKTKALLDQIAGVAASLSQLRIQQAEVEQKFTSKHPAYQTIANQIADLTAKKKALEEKITGLPDTQQKLLRLTLDVKVSTELYTSMLSQAQQLNIAQAGTVGNARIVDHAAVDVSQPVKPRRKLIVVVGILLGLFLSVAWVFLRQMLNRGIEDPRDIEQLGLPVYASVPFSPNQHNVDSRTAKRSPVRPDSGGAHEGVRKSYLLAVNEPNDLAIEAMRSLRTSLYFATMDARNNILMISGISPGVGKSFVSTNLAAVMAQAGRRVLLMDGDLRRGDLHHSMLHAGPGLSAVLSSQVSVDDAIQPTTMDTLSFLARGKIPPNPSELLMHKRFAALLQEVSARYDLVIIDTPPILAVTDAAIIGAHAGTSLLVTRFGLNQAREVELAQQRFAQNHVELKGAIFNAVQRRSTGYYSYGYYDYHASKA